MKHVQLSMRLFSDGNKPKASHQVAFQWFSLKTGKWVQFSRRNTNAQGNISVRLVATVFGGPSSAPLLRAVENGTPTPRVLSSGPMLRFDARSQILFADFGQVEVLDDAVYKRLHLDSGQANSADNIAGVPRKAEMSQAILMHNLNNDAVLRSSMTINRQPAGGLVVNSRDAISPTLATAPTANLTVSKEVETLRAILLERDANLSKETLKVVKKDAELASAKTELTAKAAALRDAERRTKAAEDAVKLAERRADTAEGTLEQLKAKAGKKASIHTVLSGLGTKLSDANTDLKTKDSPFRLGAIKVDLRGDISHDGANITLGKDNPNGSGISTELHISDTTPVSTTAVKVPDVADLTESAARRVLRSVGLRMVASQQPITPAQGTPGQARTQHPAAGQNAEHGGDVLVVFGVLNAG